MITLFLAFMAINGEYVSLVKHPFEFADEQSCEEFATQFEVQNLYPHLGAIVYECSEWNDPRIEKGNEL